MNGAEPHNEPQAAVPLDITPGRRLAAARNDQHLTVADVANRLKLSVSQVEALESDAHDRLPGPVFVRGFIRNYARLVNLDSESLMRSLKVPSGPKENREASKRPLELPLQTERRWPRYAAVAALIFGIAAAIDFLWPETDTRVASTTAAPATQDAAMHVTSAAPAALAPEAVNTAMNADATAPATATIAEQSRAAPGTASVPGVAPAVRHDAAGEAELRLLFSERSWVEIRDRDGRVILSRLNDPGTTRVVKAAAPVKLVIGSAHGVHLIFNDRPVDLAKYTRVDVARLTLE